MADRLTQKDIESSEEGVQTAKRHKKYIRDKYKKAKGYFKEMLNSETSSNQDRLTEADIKGSVGPLPGTKPVSTDRLLSRYLLEEPFVGAKPGSTDRMTTRDMREAGMTDEEISSGLSASSMKRGGSVMSRGCKMGRNKPTKLY